MCRHVHFIAFLPQLVSTTDSSLDKPQVAVDLLLYYDLWLFYTGPGTVRFPYIRLVDYMAMSKRGREMREEMPRPLFPSSCVTAIEGGLFEIGFNNYWVQLWIQKDHVCERTTVRPQNYTSSGKNLCIFLF
mmetsp:Transcript_7532/g.12139  ORF Transcript_7532/g.12139 Transcript_7532/m.12139 type:complete len:131 (-) Transcript_7532:453-845(-)